MTKIQMYAQGIVHEQVVADAEADEAVSRATRSGYTAWKVTPESDQRTNRRDR